jgi:hypothetical protein
MVYGIGVFFAVCQVNAIAIRVYEIELENTQKRQ